MEHLLNILVGAMEDGYLSPDEQKVVESLIVPRLNGAHTASITHPMVWFFDVLWDLAPMRRRSLALRTSARSRRS